MQKSLASEVFYQIYLANINQQTFLADLSGDCSFPCC